LFFLSLDTQTFILQVQGFEHPDLWRNRQAAKMSSNAFSSTLPLPLTSGLFDEGALDDQLRRLNEARSAGKAKKGSKKKKNLGSIASSLESTEDTDGAPAFAGLAWGTPGNVIPEKISSGRSSRLYL